jgi:hypothetical protein
MLITQLLLNNYHHRVITGHVTKALQLVPSPVSSSLQLAPSRFQHMSYSQIHDEYKSNREKIKRTERSIYDFNSELVQMKEGLKIIQERIVSLEKMILVERRDLSYLKENEKRIEQELYQRDAERTPLDCSGIIEPNLQSEFDKVCGLIDKVKNLQLNEAAKHGEVQSCEGRLKHLEEKLFDLKKEAEKRGVKLSQKNHNEGHAGLKKTNQLIRLYYTVLAASFIFALLIVRQVYIISKQRFQGYLLDLLDTQYQLKQTTRHLEKILQMEEMQNGTISPDVRLEIIKKEVKDAITLAKSGKKMS